MQWCVWNVSPAMGYCNPMNLIKLQSKKIHCNDGRIVMATRLFSSLNIGVRSTRESFTYMTMLPLPMKDCKIKTLAWREIFIVPHSGIALFSPITTRSLYQAPFCLGTKRVWTWFRPSSISLSLSLSLSLLYLECNNRHIWAFTKILPQHNMGRL